MPYRITTRTTQLQGGDAYNTFHSAGSTAPDAAALALAVRDWFTEFDNYLSDSAQVSFDGDAEIFDPANGQTLGIEALDPWLVAGAGPGSWAPAGTTFVCRWRTGSYINGRELRGRSYISGLTDIGAGNPGVPPLVVEAMNDAMATFIATETLAVYGPTSGSLVDVTSGTCWNRFGLMRSRRD